jgi:hypothetical protein
MDRPALVSEVGLTVVRPAVVLAKSPSTASARLSPQPSLSVSDFRHQPSDEPLTRTYWRERTEAVLQKAASLEPTPDPWRMLMM